MDKQEPVGWYDSISGVIDFTSYRPTRKPSSPSAEWVPVYTAPPNQEPVECMCGLCKLGKRDTESKIPEGRRPEWIGLTDEERSYYLQSAANVGWWQAALFVEAKLKEKNT